MIYVLLFLLIELLLFFYFLFDRNILSPSVIATGMFAISSYVASLYMHKWHATISMHTILIITTSLLAMGVGEFIVHCMQYKRIQSTPFTKIEKSPISVKRKYVVFFLFFSLILLFIYYKDTVRIATEAGYKKGGSVLMLWSARVATINEDGKFSGRSRFAKYSFTVIKNFAYLFSYIYLYNRIYFRKKSFICLLPIFMFVPFIILSTGRTEFIYLIAFLTVIGSIFFMQCHNWNPMYTFKIIRIGFIGFLCFLLLFIFVGALKSSTIISKAGDTLAFYSGLSIPSLDYYFEHQPYPRGELFGEHTLFGIYGILHRMFPDTIPSLFIPAEMVNFYHVRGNVYTALRRYHQDFGYLGLYLIMFFIGFLYSFLFLKVNRTAKRHGLLFYGLILPPLVEMSIEERFFMLIVSYQALQNFVISWLLFRFFIDRHIDDAKLYRLLFQFKSGNESWGQQ